MRKLVIVFVVAVLVPSLILAWLAVRSLRDQEMVVERQRALLHQSTTDSLAGDVNIFMDDIRVYFRDLVDELIEEEGLERVSMNFDGIIRSRWAQVEVGAVVSEEGYLIAPKRTSNDPRIEAFCVQNEGFLTNRDAAEVYPAPPQTANTIAVDVEEQGEDLRREERERASAPQAYRSRAAGALDDGDVVPVKEKVSVYTSKLKSRIPEKKQEVAQAQVRAQEAAAPVMELKTRNVVPFSQVEGQQVQMNDEDMLYNANPWSMLETRRGEFRDLMGDAEEGAFSRYLQNRLHILLWYRPPEHAGRIFCAQMDLGLLKEEIGKIVSELAYSGAKEVCVALVDETGQAVATSVPKFTTNWRKPFVASEIGEILPHWEVAAYLINPGSLSRLANSVRFTLWLMVFVLIAAIGFGSLLIFLDLARQAKLARQKTDFVSNVSHELKTPLTSIRMFSDLLSGDGAAAEAKRSEYAGIISAEAARLTRLINNLLDFSRMERGEKKYGRERIPLGELVKETVDHYREHLVSNGFKLNYNAEAGAGIEVEGDRDALSQVLLNLVSNAEKYGGGAKEITVEVGLAEGTVLRSSSFAGQAAEVRVMDRGQGVSRKDEGRIFKKFYRVDNSLSSGVQGSGLGLTLARQIAREHGGDVVFRNREGGGSCFVIVLPVAVTGADS